jgi:hypothetical protein
MRIFRPENKWRLGWITAAFILCATGFVTIAQGPSAKVEERRLIYIGQGSIESPIPLRIGEVLQVRPFSYVLQPELEEASLKVKLTGDSVLAYVGQAPSPTSGEGRSSLNAFFYAVNAGEGELKVQLLRSSGKPVDGKLVKYRVIVKAN